MADLWGSQLPAIISAIAAAGTFTWALVAKAQVKKLEGMAEHLAEMSKQTEALTFQTSELARHTIELQTQNLILNQRFANELEATAASRYPSFAGESENTWEERDNFPLTLKLYNNGAPASEILLLNSDRSLFRAQSQQKFVKTGGVINITIDRPGGKSSEVDFIIGFKNHLGQVFFQRIYTYGQGRYTQTNPPEKQEFPSGYPIRP